MTFEERNNIVGILAGLLIISIYVSRIGGMHAAGVFDRPDGLMIWARATLWLIGLGVVFAIVGTVLAAILYAILSGDKTPGMLVDERDQMIKIWGMRVTLVVMSVALIAALFALAFGWTAFAVLNLILAGFSLGDMAGNITKLGLYRSWL